MINLMDGETGMIVLYCIIGFFFMLIIVGGTIMFSMWQRRKWTYTNFLDDTGKWRKKHWGEGKLGSNFDYEGNTYEFDIKKCTRDNLNRPIAHYYIGNPKQQIFNYDNKHKMLNINTHEITGKDFMVLMTSKVLRDIFQDEEVMNMLWMILIVIGVSTLIIGILVYTHNPPVTLKNDNSTIDMMARACKMAILNKGV